MTVARGRFVRTSGYGGRLHFDFTSNALQILSKLKVYIWTVEMGWKGMEWGGMGWEETEWDGMG